MPRDFIFESVLLGAKDLKEKDRLLFFLTRENAVIKVVDYGARKNGGKSFPLYSTGNIYLYKAENSENYTLRDSCITLSRAEIFMPDKIHYMTAFLRCIDYFAPADSDFIFSLTESSFNMLNNNFNPLKVFVYFAEKIFCSDTGISVYTECPECGKVYAENENVGYSNSLNSPVCNSCADLHSLLLPGMRRYLVFRINSDEEQFCKMEISPAALKRVVDFEVFRLCNLNRKFDVLKKLFS